MTEKPPIKSFKELRVYQGAFSAAMELFRLTQTFPPNERFSIVDQMRRSSRSVCTNIAEAWRKRRYPAAFVAKLSDAESEAAETQVWLEFAVECEYLDRKRATDLADRYETILAQLVTMIQQPEKWVLH
jgi:four helix bundle protein